MQKIEGNMGTHTPPPGRGSKMSSKSHIPHAQNHLEVQKAYNKNKAYGFQLASIPT